MRQITEIIVHCSATRPDWMQGMSFAAKVSEIARWHMSPPRNWRAIGYHYLIDRDGALANGRPLEHAGAHVKGRNATTIGICLLGGFGSAETDQFSEHFTAEQKKTLLKLIEELRERFGDIPVSGHNQYAAKACPGFNVPDFMKDNAPRVIDTPVHTDEPPLQKGGWLVTLLHSIFGGRK